MMDERRVECGSWLRRGRRKYRTRSKHRCGSCLPSRNRAEAAYWQAADLREYVWLRRSGESHEMAAARLGSTPRQFSNRVQKWRERQVAA